VSVYPWRNTANPEAAADFWNAHYPPGTAVTVQGIETQTRGKAWASRGRAYCCANGVDGAQPLASFTPKCKKRVPA